MIVLGLDPGSRHFGWGVVTRTGTRLSHVAHGVVDTDLKGTFGHRLVTIEKHLVEVLDTYKPTFASVETLFFAKDAQAAAKLGHARGIALLVCARANIPTFEYAPALVKRTVAGTGRADKTQVAQMIRVFLRLADLPRSDAADALAIAVTHLQQQPIIEAAERAARAGDASLGAAVVKSAAKARLAELKADFLARVHAASSGKSPASSTRAPTHHKRTPSSV